MANPWKGEALAILKDKREFTLCFDFEAACVLEDLADCRINELLGEMAGPPLPGEVKPSFRQPRFITQARLLYAATRAKHEALTLGDCQQLVSAHNAEILWPMLRALGMFLGRSEEIASEEEGEAAGAAANPPQSAVGIGPDCTADGASSGSTLTPSGDRPLAATAES
jgi:hypothetical protein